MTKNRILIIFAIVLLGAFLRLYKINEYMTFLGDEGRDAIIVRRLLVEYHPPLIGPGTSIGNMYLGPLYYYFMAPWLFLAGFSPVGPAVGIALLGVATIFLVWYLAREWFGDWAAAVASFLYAIAPTVIIYSQSSWNPNIMPFFALLCIVAIWKIWNEKAYKWFFVLGFSYAFVLQSHYLGLLLAPVFLVFWFLSLRDALNKKRFILYTIYSILIFLLLMSPMVIFDIRHNFQNFNSIKKFFAERQTTVSIRPWNAIPQIWPLSERIATRILTGRNLMVGKWASLLFLVPVIWLLGVGKKTELTSTQKRAFLIIIVWLASALFGLGVYKQEIYDHYFGILFPLPFLLVGGISQVIINNARRRGVSIVIVGVFVLTIINLLENPLKYSPNNQLNRTIVVSDEVTKLANGSSFNMALIAERNYDSAYKYFLLTKNIPVIDIDAQNTKETIKDKLFVICELPKEKCDPTHNPKAEVANFGWSKIEAEWNIAGTTVFKLGHVKDDKKN